MTKKPDKLNDLRRRAEATWSGQAVDLSQLSPADLHHLVHELQVHQIELELQNEDLRQAQEQLAISQARYADLYDFAPVGYFTLDRKSMIQQANLTGADMLGVPRNELLQLPLSRFVAPDSQDDFYRHCRQTLQEGEKQTCEILLVKKDGSVFYARLESTAVPNPDGRISQMHTIVSDISGRVRAEDALREAHER
ncbi:MAG: PAS domain-containing protein, partial [Anaerolineae bacterium]